MIARSGEKRPCVRVCWRTRARYSSFRRPELLDLAWRQRVRAHDRHPAQVLLSLGREVRRLLPGMQPFCRASIHTYCSDGNLVIYGYYNAIWASGTNGWWGAYLDMQNDGNLVIYYPVSYTEAVWATGTNVL